MNIQMINTHPHQHHRHQSHKGMADMVAREVLSKTLSKGSPVMTYGSLELVADLHLDSKMETI